MRIGRQKYDDSRPTTTGEMGGRLEQPPAAMLEISRRHSVMLHRSCIPSFEIERATMSRPERPVARSAPCTDWFESFKKKLSMFSALDRIASDEIALSMQPVRSASLRCSAAACGEGKTLAQDSAPTDGRRPIEEL
jgi:hypothetical protein